MRVEQDAWNPPANIIKAMGRLNKVNESLLYTAPGDPLVAIKEAKVKDGEFFSLIVYKARDEIKVNRIGNFERIEQLTELENLKLRLLINFLRDEFTKDVGQGTEYLYRVSERIAKDYFDLPPKVAQDAWLYPSVAKKESFNVCFRPELAKELLDLQGVVICRLSDKGIESKAIANGFDDEGIFKYHAIGSQLQKQVFPEIT
ncbi:hypothetical protein BTR25_13530 [Bacillus sp. MRMR6]|nr:hypothetical protein BTR25_13530 [Bacillus sp. MRMR6]